VVAQHRRRRRERFAVVGIEALADRVEPSLEKQETAARLLAACRAGPAELLDVSGDAGDGREQLGRPQQQIDIV
jgi:hypothetical protein